MNENAVPALTERASQIADVQGAAKLADALAGQLSDAVTREDALGAVLAVIVQGGNLRDTAAGLYAELIESGDEG